MKDTDTKHRFIELRAQGKSLRTAADELAVGLQTAVRWERELKEQIENLKAMELDALLERHRLTLQAQIERYGVELTRVTDELQKRDLAGVQTPKLYDIMIKLHARIDAARPALTLRDDDEIADQKALRELVASRRGRNAPLERQAMSRPVDRTRQAGAHLVTSKALVDNQTVSVTVTGTNPAGNLTTQSTAFAGVNKAVNIPPKSTNEEGNQSTTSSAQSSGSTSAQSSGSTSAQSRGSTSNPVPGFEAVFVVAGLTSVAYLLNRRR
jgi:PGF-CTERM protein